MKPFPHSTQLKCDLGFSTIELLIAFSVGIIFLTAAMMVSFSDPSQAQHISLNSNQTTILDSALDSVALSTSSNKLGASLATLIGNWNAIILPNSDTFYTNSPFISDTSICLKEIYTVTNWNTVGNRGRQITLGTALGGIETLRALGGDCSVFPVTESWHSPKVLSSHHFSPSKPISLDVFNKTAYITDDSGAIQINNTTGNAPGDTSVFDVTPYVDAFSKQLNDIDVAQQGTHRYAYVVRHATTSQFQVVDVTTPGTYTVSPAKTLSGTAPPSGSFPQGWRVFYYDNRAYVTTRETAGREFHTFDVTTPMNPIELGSALEINGTINDLLVTKVKIGGSFYTFAFLATDKSTSEVMVLNVTNPSVQTLITVIDLPATSNALSIQLLGNRLYIGRQKTANGPELFIYDISYGVSGANPTIILSRVGTGLEVGSDVTTLVVAGKFAFIGNPLTTTELKIFDISNPTIGFTRVDTTPLTTNNKIVSVDFEAPYLYIASQANSALQVLESEP